MLMETAEARGGLLEVYRVPDPLFVRGCGCELVDREGRIYLDFTSGIGVNALGFGSREVRQAVEEALASGLIHTSNLFRTAPAEELAAFLVEHSFPSKVFLCNSGAEAGEAAFKFARRWAREVGGEEKHQVLSFRGAFHGRLFGTLAATDRPDYRAPFEPLMPGVQFLPLELRAVEAAISRERTAAVVLEPIQGEGGIRPVPAGFLQGLRELCTRHRVALILDEIQCGVGRTGRLWAHQHAGVTPDILTAAKPLAGGFPMGAVLVSPEIATAIRPGDHGTTFGGGPLISSVALAVLRAVLAPGFLEAVSERGEELERGLRELQAMHPGRIREVRGVGLMLGMELEGPVGDLVSRAREEGLLLVGAGPTVLRFLPPLIVSRDEVARGVEILGRVLGESP